MSKRDFVCPLILVALSLAGCSGAGEQASESGTEEQSLVRRATAHVQPTAGSEAFGTAIFINGPAVDLQIDIEDAPPGIHAIHIHETGDCSAEDGSSAGGHWNPEGHDHGQWGAEPFHLGDIGNLTVGEDGKGTLMLSTDKWSMGTGKDNDIMGKAIILHASEDDFESQPTGNAGGRIGCGVIK